MINCECLKLIMGHNLNTSPFHNAIIVSVARAIYCATGSAAVLQLVMRKMTMDEGKVSDESLRQTISSLMETTTTFATATAPAIPLDQG